MAAEDGERRIRRLAEEVEEHPGGEESGEEDERDRIRQERDREDAGDDREVVGAEIAVVFPQAEAGVGEGLRLRETGAIEELRPRAAVGEAGLNGLRDAGPESAHGGVGGGLLIAGDGSGGGGI